MRRLKYFLPAIALAFTFVIAAIPAAIAFSVQPLLVEMEPGRSGAIRVENTRTDPLTVEVTLWRRSVDENGVQTRVAADDDFVVLPPQMVIPPGRVQVVRLQWVGSDTPDRSISYYANLREVPVELNPSSGAQVQIAFAFDVAVQVAPRSARPNLTLHEAAVAHAPDGSALARLTIENTGARYAYLQDAQYDLEVLDRAGAVIARPSYTEDELTTALGVTLLEPGKRRIADLPINVPGAASVRGRVRAGGS